MGNFFIGDMKQTDRVVRVSIPYIQEAMASKDAFDALALCLLVKLNITDSTIRNATMRRLKEVTHMGNDKLKRVISYCIDNGMAKRDGNALVFEKLCNEGCCFYKFTHKYEKRNRNQTLQFNIKLTNVKDMMRKAVVANHIRKVENIREQVYLTKDPKNLHEYKKARRSVRKLFVWGDRFFISNGRLAKIANCSISKVRDIKRRMIEQGTIERNYCNTLVSDDAKKFSLSNYYRYGDVGNAFLFERGGKIYRHEPNIYSYKGANILVVLKKNK